MYSMVTIVHNTVASESQPWSLGLLAAPVACENKIICVRPRSAAKMSSFVLLSGGGRCSAWSASCVISSYLMAVLLCG